MVTPFVVELAEHAMALRALARVLVGERHADDLVQEVTLQALQVAPPTASGIRGWLQVVLRRQASNLRRGEQRRRRREAATADRASVHAPATVAVAEQHEVARRVTDLLLGLPEPYRDTLFRRFFHDATPTAIAASMQVPLATVKSRLQRGLTMLRERLDSGSRTDWRPALGAAFGFDAGIRTASTALAGGMFVMGMGVKLWFAAASATLLGLLYLAGSWPDPGPAAVATTTGPSPAAAAASSVPTRDVGDGPVRMAPSSEAKGGAATATVRGRCVDEHGQPLASVHAAWQTIDLRGNDRSLASSSMLTTGSDGAFEFVFDAEARVLWELSLQALDRVTMRCSICAIPAGDVVELGAVPLPRGTRLVGRLVDRKGKPQAEVSLRFSGRRADVADSASVFRTQAETHTDGTFAATEHLPPGDYHLDILERRGITPAQVTLDGTQSVVHVDLVVDEITAPMAMAGVVVDARGLPVEGAEVRVHHEDHVPNEVLATTDAAGRFRLAREVGAPDAVPLHVRCDGYEQLRLDDQVWGRMDVELTLRSAVPVELRVTAAATGAPVEAYEACFVRIENERAKHDDSVRVRGRHQGGIAHIQGLRRGNYRLLVEPKAPELGRSRFVPCVADDSGPLRITVQLAPTAERPVRVQFADGSPVVGSEIELVDAFGHDVDEHSDACGVRDLFDTKHDALWLAAATTDASGRAVLRGPVDRPLAFLVSGKSHLPTAVNGVMFAGEDPLVVTVRRGARLHGRVQPLHVLEAHARLAGFGPDHAWPDCAPRLMLVSPHDQETVPLERDGTFALHGLAPGRWDLRMRWPRRVNGQFCLDDWPCHRSVDLVEDQDTALDLDVAHFALGELQALVLHNGSPVVDQLVQLYCSTTECNGQPGENIVNAHTDRDGRCTIQLVPGHYSLGYPGPGFGRSIRALERADVGPAQRVVGNYTIWTGTVRLRLEQALGKPVRGVVPTFSGPDSSRQDTASDERGVVEVVLPVGKYEVQIQGPNGTARTIGEATITAGRTTELAMQVPPEPRR